MKKMLWVLLFTIVLTLSAYKAYFMVMPEVVISNQSGISVKTVTVQLPSNRIVFGYIAPGNTDIIYYSFNQNDGVYKYIVLFESGEIISNECGRVTDNEIGKIFRITILSAREVVCSGNDA